MAVSWMWSADREVDWQYLDRWPVGTTFWDRKGAVMLDVQTMNLMIFCAAAIGVFALIGIIDSFLGAKA